MNEPDVPQWMVDVAKKTRDVYPQSYTKPFFMDAVWERYYQKVAAIIAKHYAARDVPQLALEDLPTVILDLAERLRGLGLKIVQIEDVSQNAQEIAERIREKLEDRLALCMNDIREDIDAIIIDAIQPLFDGVAAFGKRVLELEAKLADSEVGGQDVLEHAADMLREGRRLEAERDALKERLTKANRLLSYADEVSKERACKGKPSSPCGDTYDCADCYGLNNLGST